MTVKQTWLSPILAINMISFSMRISMAVVPSFHGGLLQYNDMQLSIKLSYLFSYLWDRICSILSGAGKFCLAHGLKQLAHDVKNDIKTPNFRSDVIFDPHEKH